MKPHLLGMGVVAMILVIGLPAWAQEVEADPGPDQALRDRVDRLERELADLKALLAKPPAPEEGERVEPEAEAGEPGRGDIPTAEDRALRFTQRGEASTFGGIYTKPFLAQADRRIYLGGYVDIEFREEGGANKEFDQHRLIPFIYGDVSERIRFATEIEIEHGGELEVEFAQIDYLWREEINFRAGIILAPLGRLNLVHDSPIQDLTDRPLVDLYVIPTTLSESGAGLFGAFYPGEEGKLDYEVYVVNGFSGLTADGATSINTSKGLRSARGSKSSDNNNSPDLVARVGYSPFLGLDLGGSVHTGPYDDKGDNRLTIWALDAQWQHGPFELLGEFAYADLARDAFARTAGVPDDLWGYYIQGNYHFLPGFLRRSLPSIFTDESTFTAVIRWGQIDLDGFRRDRLTLGLNFRPTEDTVFKLDYQINNEHGNLGERDDNAFLFSMASYF